MSVRIRLMRVGRKKNPQYRIVAVDSRKKRDGAYLELLGSYQPRFHPAKLEVKEDKILHWMQLGAVPSDTVRTLLSRQGILLRFDLLKRNAPAEKIAEATIQWQAKAQQRAAREAQRGLPGRKKKAAVQSSPTAEEQVS
ncbi:MAG: 30S ribosomal protein S16 [bacterium]